MAESPGNNTQQLLMYEEKWAMHYSSNHKILLVGDGDFSFSCSLALTFESASNIVATSLDSYDRVIKKYKSSEGILNILDLLDAKVLHGVDATKMKHHTDLQALKFDRIVYNFPHAGFWGKEDDDRVIKKHQNVVRGFFRNASDMLLPNGEVHVTHKTGNPYDLWNIVELADDNDLWLFERVEFKQKDYPGYNPKRGQGSRCDESFHLGKCITFKFVPFSEFFDYALSMNGQADEYLEDSDLYNWKSYEI